MKNRKLVFIFLLSAFSPVFSSPALNLQNNQQLYDLGSYVSFFKDPENQLKIEDIIQQDRAGSIFKQNRDNPNFGLTRSRIWGKVDCKNSSSRQKDWFLIFESERLEEINIYVVSPEKIISKFHYDRFQSFQERYVKHRKLVFPLDLEKSFQTVYFSVKSEDSMELGAVIASPIGFAKKNYDDMLIAGLYYGIMISMIIYNTFIFFTTRDKSYIFYIVYILSYSLVQFSMDGLLHEYIFNQSFGLARDLRIFFSTSAMIFALLFAISLLEVKQKFPGLYKAYLIVLMVCLIPAVLQSIFGFSIGLISLVYVLFAFCPFQLVSGLILARKTRLGRYYFAAWFVFIFGILIHGLTYLHIYVPFPEKMNYSMQWGSAIEALILSLALGYRINLLRQSIMEKDTELLNAKFSNLRDKMNPHFVLNTLSIIMSYLKRDVEKADAALSHFTSAYKYLIRHENQHITSMENEIEFTKDYANILLIKFGDTLKIEYDIQGKLDKISIPFLSLQPIVENAFKHGIRKLEKGKIHIRIRVSIPKVEIVVKNTSNEWKIKNPFNGTLGAIRRRIQHFFEDGDLTIRNENNETIVQINYKNIIKQDNVTLSPGFNRV
ncbi:MAG: histidine kinase [Spirochaetia bacterium]|nr:histidine kinase [Spirochaetia bacterium]